jgi:hypothetical protein
MDRIRTEEMVILQRTLAEYPIEQLWSFIGNGVRQIGMIGLDDTSWGRVSADETGQFRLEPSTPFVLQDLASIETVQKTVVLAGIARFAVRRP